MSNQDDSNSKKNKGDLTSLFDLSDFEHTDDPETEAYFQEKEDLGNDDQDKEVNPEDSNTDTLFDDQDDDQDKEQETESYPSELTQTEFNPQTIFDNDVDDNDGAEAENEDGNNSEFTDEGDNEDSFSSEFTDFESGQDDEIDNDFESSFNEANEPDAPHNFNDEIKDDQEEFNELNESEVLKEAELATIVAATTETAAHYEKFDDIQKFAKNSHYGPVSAKGEPPFSMIIEDVKYKEDASRILAILKEYGFLNQGNELIITKGLERGSAIISRVSEFAVIFLYTKLSQLPIKLKVGPSDLIFPSSSSEHTHQGSVSSDHLLQNREDSKLINNTESTSILFSSQSEIQGYIVEEFLGHYFETLEFQAYPEAGELDQSLDQLQTREVFSDMKRQVIIALKNQLQKINANAGIDYEVNTQALFTEDKQDYTYQITAKCNAVWIKKT